MEMDVACRIRVPDTEKDFHQGPDFPELRSGKADHSTNGDNWISDCRQTKSVRRIRGSLDGQFLLPEVMFSETELKHK
jgi:hypothetical protein